MERQREHSPKEEHKIKYIHYYTNKSYTYSSHQYLRRPMPCWPGNVSLLWPCQTWQLLSLWVVYRKEKAGIPGRRWTLGRTYSGVLISTGCHRSINELKKLFSVLGGAEGLVWGSDGALWLDGGLSGEPTISVTSIVEGAVCLYFLHIQVIFIPSQVSDGVED